MAIKVAQAGVGVRGRFHLNGLLGNKDKYELVGLCDINEEKLRNVALDYGLDIPLYIDAECMLKETKPDLFIFVTMPEVRSSMVDLAAKYGIKNLSFEKPMAVNLREARQITETCRANNMKAVVCHQQKYSQQMQEIHRLVQNGEIGAIEKIHVETQSWLAQLGTHFLDYALWINGGKARVQSVVGHAHGNWILSDSHPSPDYILGEAKLEDGVRVYIECGYFSQRHHYVPRFGYDNRLTVYGTHGYAWAETDGKWAVFSRNTGGEIISGDCPVWDEQEPHLQIPYYSDLAGWIFNKTESHPCNIESSYHGYEVLEGLCLSALDNTRVDLPLKKLDYEPVFDRMKKTFVDVNSPRRRTEIEILG